ncbi:hypothetical protein RIF29_23827 [Crotalaria pallida]|uniref:Uncharacterized protein n=1 Tax=Crotalaria pallida TaxID=3830 RepID=A0AAN9F6J0_CROPI
MMTTTMSMSMSKSRRRLVVMSDGVIVSKEEAPPIKEFLEGNGGGAYTTTRTHNNSDSLLFWDRHFHRLSHDVHLLSNQAPHLLLSSSHSPPPPHIIQLPPTWQPTLHASLSKLFSFAFNNHNHPSHSDSELAITTLVTATASSSSSGSSSSYILNVHLHLDSYVPPAFGVPAHLALAGYGRPLPAAAAKYSLWVRNRSILQNLRPPSVTELLLSNDGHHILEGSITNFFVVSRKKRDSDDGKAMHDFGNKYPFEVQTAPISDGVLPGIIRQLVLEVCRSEGIPIREIAPSWSEREIWEEAFITNSLRLLQHVDSIQVPTDWQSAHSKTWKDISWTKKQFLGKPGMITTIILEKIMDKAILEGYPISNICAW